MFVFRSKLWNGILSGIAYCAIVGVNDVLTAAAFQACGVSASAFMSDHSYRGIFLIAGNLFLFGIILILYMIGKKGQNRLSVKILLPVLPCWLISILLCLLFTWQCIIEETPVKKQFLFQKTSVKHRIYLGGFSHDLHNFRSHALHRRLHPGR